jgi:hypothetical protein
MLKMIKELKNIKILDSWYHDREELEDKKQNFREQIASLRRQIRGVDKELKVFDMERKLEPPIIARGSMTGTIYKVIRYQILDIEKGLYLAEMKEEEKEPDPLGEYCTTINTEIKK